MTGIVLGAVVFAMIIGGIQRTQAASAIVPLMSVLYLLACLIVLLINIESVPEAFATILGNAFSGEAAAGGAFGQVVLMGFKRGIFSNEAGLGSAPIAHAAAKTNDPVRQGTVAMLGTIDTLIICTMTALVIITAGVYANGEAGAVLSITAFNTGLMGWWRSPLAWWCLPSPRCWAGASTASATPNSSSAKKRFSPSASFG